MPPIVWDSFADVVEEGYDPANDGVEDHKDPHDQTSLLAALANPLLPFQKPFRTLFSSVPSFSIVVPFPLDVGEGDEHRDAVYAVKRAYARSVSYYRLRQLMRKPLEQRRRWGKDFSEEFGQRNYTKARHTLLAPYFDAFAISLLHSDKPPASPRDKQIALQLGWFTAFYNRRMSIIYSQIRPSQLGPAEWITRADCSGMVAGSCKWANILPAVDWRYTNTWSQISFGHEVVFSLKKVGDVFLYGSPSHEALYLGNGLVGSMGSYPAKILPHDYRHDRCAIRRFVP